MSRVFDAKQEALAAYPDNRDKACSMFLGYLDCSESDFEYEQNQSVEHYIFGDQDRMEEEADEP